MFKNRKKLNSQAKKMDKLITGLILGSAVASIFGLTQTKKGREISRGVVSKIKPNMISKLQRAVRKSVIDILNTNKKSLIQKILRRKPKKYIDDYLRQDLGLEEMSELNKENTIIAKSGKILAKIVGIFSKRK